LQFSERYAAETSLVAVADLTLGSLGQLHLQKYVVYLFIAIEMEIEIKKYSKPEILKIFQSYPFCRH